MNYQTISFVLASLAFGYYIGYSWRAISDPSAFYDDLVGIGYPALSILLIAFGLACG